MKTYDATNELPIPPLQAPITSPTVMPLVLSLFDSQYFLPPEENLPPKDTETPVESSIPVSLSSSVGSSSPVRSITPPPGYPFNESIFAELDNSLWIIPRPPLGSKPVPVGNKMLQGIPTASYGDPLLVHFPIRVKRLERELKARTPPTKIHKVDVRGRSRSVMAWVPKKV
uniref:Uncharacterized protein n=1 Tax=Tanacetum cinerariifolium TaxID=118510 RepID=A0A699KEZ6_TANCI|nr:hypothetical protein [Tanacetum cinerariifolium]